MWGPANIEVVVGPVETRREGGRDRHRQTAHLSPAIRGVDSVWWEVETHEAVKVRTDGDAALLAVVQPAMEHGLTVRVVGAPVSPSLLDGLTEAQRAWHDWGGWAPVAMEAETTTHDPWPVGDAAIAAFSGGVDSAFTVARHAHGDAGHQQRTLDAACFIAGNDLPVDHPDRAAAVARARSLLDAMEVDVPLVEAASSSRDLTADWERYHGFALASSLTAVGGAQGAALVAASDTYARPVMGWGSNPVTDHLLGSRRFAVVHDGCGVTRVDKVAHLAHWPDAIARLRFCWVGPGHDRNCGTCLKCVTMAMILRVLDVAPSCFDRPPDDATIVGVLRASGPSGFTHTYNQPILDRAEERGLRDPWVAALRWRLRRARLQPPATVIADPVVRRVRAVAGRPAPAPRWP